MEIPIVIYSGDFESVSLIIKSQLRERGFYVISDNFTLRDVQVSYICKMVDEQVSELELLVHDLDGNKLDFTVDGGIDHVRDCINSILADDFRVVPRHNPKYNYKLLEQELIKALNTTSEKVRGKCRELEAVMVRQVVMSVMVANNVSKTKAGERYGRDHSTVLHGLKSISNLFDTKGLYYNEIVNNLVAFYMYADLKRMFEDRKKKHSIN